MKALHSAVIGFHSRRAFAAVPALLAVACLVLAFLSSGCLSGAKIPPNSHIRDFSAITTTPWGSVEVKAAEVDTGKAAVNTTARQNP